MVEEVAERERAGEEGHGRERREDGKKGQLRTAIEMLVFVLSVHLLSSLSEPLRNIKSDLRLVCRVDIRRPNVGQRSGAGGCGRRGKRGSTISLLTGVIGHVRVYLGLSIPSSKYMDT